ncbi:MAG: glutamyl-tRNA reductase [Chloroflexi bacterium]|nr:glutamyl-tRNA reductase [Chloroflexota bacterium]
MHISLVGINHQTAPVSIREKVAISADRLPDFLALLHAHVPQGVILSTCNRTEIYSVDGDESHATRSNLDFLKALLDLPDINWQRYVYTMTDESAVAHLFQLTSGLDSMIIGEYEILGQVGNALEAADKAKMVGFPLRHIFQSAIRTGRRVREETGISKNALSVSSVAVDLAGRIIGDLKDCRMLVIGVGEAGRLVAKAAKDRGVTQIAVASRTLERASALAQRLGGKSVSLSNVTEELGACNILVTCASAPRRLLDFPRIESVMKARAGLPMVIIDIAVPRNVEATVGQIESVFLYNIDDLTQISELNRKQREREIEMAKVIIAGEMEKFTSWRKTFEVTPVVRSLMQKAEDIRRAQLSRTLKKLRPLSDEERDSLEAMTRSIVTKILKDPIEHIKTNGNGNQEYAEILSELFQLHHEKKE